MNRTIRVLLADDEPVILRGLKKLISWDSLGLDIVGEACDGYELKAMIDSCNPDLVISDISMPGFSGIDIIRDIHDSGRAIKVVFISAYQEFAYARQALQYGALDYLVKPVNTGQLEQVVSRAVAVIRQESEEERNKEMLKSYERKSLSMTAQEQLEQLTDGNKAAATALALMGNTAISRYASVCVIQTDEYSDQPSRWEERERKLVEFALSNIIKETVDGIGNGYVFRKGERFAVLLQHEHVNEPLQWMEDLHQKINSYLKLQVSIGIGQPMSGMEEAAESYRSALKALKSRYFAGLNRVIPYAAEEMVPVPLSRLAFIQAGLSEALKLLDRERLGHLTGELLETVRLLSGGSRNQAVSHVYNAIIQLEQDLADFGSDAGLLNPPDKPLLEKLTDAPTFAALQQVFEAVLYNMFNQLTCRISGKEVPQLLQVRSYVEAHFAENITLESMAALVYMNPYYFSSFFKKHTGQNFKNYVTEVRMDHALKLLLQNDLMIYEIADRVGYNNARHFSDMFKKQFGKLPQEYKQSFKN
ncbi:response regulator [Paenibacillus donghaensis]|uniref:Two-component system response regulator n=1 Tax=Paenibacillus donghaensis TaxID=414771 RepID=A0A2Z2K9J5_9BACL|nr:response regulator [Paenibacillus donghaensis]ASA22164.1 two-component system response regulator [Paenibacillus donghaensis]